MKNFVKAISVLLMGIILFNSLIIVSSALTPTYTPSDSYINSDYYRKLCAVSLTGNQREDIVAVALSQEGYYESNSSSQLGGANLGGGTYDNYTEYYYWYSGGKSAKITWCAVFLSWCAAQAQIPTSVVKKASVAKAQSFCDNYYDFGAIEPQKGDIIAHSKDNQHVGLIYEVDDNFIYTIEGNMSERVKKYQYSKTTGKVTYDGGKSYSSPAIVRIACPNYSNSSTPTYSATKTLGEKIDTTISVKKSGRNMTIEITSDFINNGVWCAPGHEKYIGPKGYGLCDFFIDDFDSSSKNSFDSNCHSFSVEIDCLKYHKDAEFVDLFNDASLVISYVEEQYRDSEYGVRHVSSDRFIAGWDRFLGREKTDNITCKCSGNVIFISLTLPEDCLFNDSQITIGNEFYGEWAFDDFNSTHYDSSLFGSIWYGIVSFFSNIIDFFKNLFVFG